MVAQTTRPVPECWIETTLDNGKYFKAVGSGVEYWEGLKNYIPTKSVQGTRIVELEDEIRYLARPSRANMQPKIGMVAFAKMKNTVKVLLIDKQIQDHCILSTGFSLIAPLISSEYLFQFFQSWRFNHYKDLYSEGSTQQAISNDDYECIFIRFPQSLPEQQKIAEVLNTVDVAIEQTARLIEKYKRVKQGLMQDLFRYGIDENGKIRSETTHHFKDSPLGRIPAEWQDQKFEDICKVRQGLQIAISQRLHESGENRYQYITIQYLNDPKSFNDYVENPPESVICRKDDILLTRTGNTGVVVTDIEGVFHNNFFLIDYDRSKVLKDWLVLYLNRDEIQNQLILNAGVTTIPDLKHGDFYNTPCVYPKLLDEQARIASIVSSANEAIVAEEAYRQKLLAIKSGLMEDLLSGKVRVTHLIKQN